MYLDYVRKAADILVVYYIIYRLILLIKGTKAMQVVWGVFVLALITFSAKALGFQSTFWLLQQFWFAGVFLLIVVFQQEIRNALANIGTNPLGRIFIPQEYLFISELTSALRTASEEKIGMLVVLEQDMGLKDIIETGVSINGEVSKELILTIFHDQTILHDGAVVIANNRVIAAGCQLPLTEQKELSKILGMRHRSAIGLSEITDAIIVVVSEETGTVSLARNGKLQQRLNIDDLEKTLFDLYKSKIEKTLLRRSPRKEEGEQKAENAKPQGTPGA